MVDFNNETTIATPAVDIVRVLILERDENFLEALEIYTKKRASGVQWPTSELSGRLTTLWYRIKFTMQRHSTPEEFKDLETLIKSKKEEDILKAYSRINQLLDKIRLSRVDTGKDYDRTYIEAENADKVD